MPGLGMSVIAGYERAKRDSKNIKYLSNKELSDRVKEYLLKKKDIDSYGAKAILALFGLAGLAATAYFGGKIFHYNSEVAASFVLLAGMPIHMAVSNIKLSVRSYVKYTLEFAEEECKKRDINIESIINE